MAKAGRIAALRRYKGLRDGIAPDYDSLSPEVQQRVDAQVLERMSRDERRVLKVKASAEFLREVANG